MKKEKQIEEMAKDLCPLYEEYGSCKKCDEELDIEDEPCLYKCMSKLCIEKGYRKASDVAEEAIDEFIKLATKYVIDKGLHLVTFKNAMASAKAELKKKYAEEKDDDR